MSKIQLLKKYGADVQPHSGRVFLEHLEGTAKLLQNMGCRQALIDAGLYHSIYGTEFFKPWNSPTREEVKAVIGEEAEYLAWVFCKLDRKKLSANNSKMLLLDGSSIENVSLHQDMLYIALANLIEQNARVGPKLVLWALKNVRYKDG